MHWGHANTKDFVNFEHLPIALYPSKDFDRNGCFSVSAIEIDGQLYLYYTAIKYAKENPSNVHNALFPIYYHMGNVDKRYDSFLYNK